MTLEQRYRFDFKKIMSDKIKRENALFFIKEFEKKLASGSIMNIGPAYGFDYRHIASVEGVPKHYSICDYIDLAVGKATDTNPFNNIEPKLKETIQQYAQLNYIHMKDLGFNSFNEPLTKDEAFCYLDTNHILLNHSIEKDTDIKTKIDNLNAIIKIDLNNSAVDVTNQWFLTYYLFNENKLIGVIESELITSNSVLSTEDYINSSMNKSDFIFNHASHIVENYLGNIFCPHLDVNSLYSSQYEDLIKSGTLHMHLLEMAEGYESDALIHVFIGSLIDALSNANVLNCLPYLEVGFDENESPKQIKNFDKVIINKKYNSELNISHISLITAQPTALLNFKNFEKDALRILNTFKYSSEKIALPHEPDVKVHIVK